MAETYIQFRFSGVPELTRRLTVMEAAVQDMRPAWAILRDRFVTNVGRAFANQGGSSGKWAALTPEYGAWKAEHYGDKKILERTGDLLRSFTSELAIDIREPHMMMVGSDNSYGGYSQTGTKKMARRPMIDMSEYERRTWVSVIRAHLMASDTAAAA
jgi:phage gpG-like protein